MAMWNISPTPAYNMCGHCFCSGFGLVLGLGSWPSLRLCLCFGFCCPSPFRWLARRCTCGCVPLPALPLSSPILSLLAFTGCINLSFCTAFSLAPSPAFFPFPFPFPLLRPFLCHGPCPAWTRQALRSSLALNCGAFRGTAGNGWPTFFPQVVKNFHVYSTNFAMSVKVDWALRMSFWGTMFWSWIPLKIAFRSGGVFTNGSLSLFCESTHSGHLKRSQQDLSIESLMHQSIRITWPALRRWWILTDWVSTRVFCYIQSCL